MTHLPFEDGSLDAITFNASFHHTPDMPKTLRECFRVLKPGGTIAMVNEEFASWRQTMFKGGSATETGSHHSIPYVDFEREISWCGFQIRYLVAHHVRVQFRRIFSASLGGFIADMLERFPLSLKQLNSALILLTKPMPKSMATAQDSDRSTELTIT
jgi:SAM-dependent methyltransferase